MTVELLIFSPPKEVECVGNRVVFTDIILKHDINHRAKKWVTLIVFSLPS
jgi:hypothetical protein